MSRIRVTCAIIEINSQLLVVQRSEEMRLPLKWEFPGGKIEQGESAEECIKREIQEELNLEIEILERLSSSYFDYPEISIELIPFVVTPTNGHLNLSEHKDFIFINRQDLTDLDWAEADLPIIREYLKM